MAVVGMQDLTPRGAGGPPVREGPAAVGMQDLTPLGVGRHLSRERPRASRGSCRTASWRRPRGRVVSGGIGAVEPTISGPVAEGRDALRAGEPARARVGERDRVPARGERDRADPLVLVGPVELRAHRARLPAVDRDGEDPLHGAVDADLAPAPRPRRRACFVIVRAAVQVDRVAALAVLADLEGRASR